MHSRSSNSMQTLKKKIMGPFRKNKVIGNWLDRCTSEWRDSPEFKQPCCNAGVPKQTKILRNTAFILLKGFLTIFKTLHVKD